MSIEFNTEHLWWFLLYVTCAIVALGAAQFYLRKVEFLQPVRGILVWCLYALTIFAVVQFGLPLIGVNIL